jgi:hypothetical protein
MSICRSPCRNFGSLESVYCLLQSPCNLHNSVKSKVAVNWETKGDIIITVITFMLKELHAEQVVTQYP